jgi:Fur family transcriptional regulator, stress-responsive regulator
MTSPTQRLRKAGIRNTGPRLATLEWLEGHPHPTAEQVEIGALAALIGTGLVRRIEPAAHPARYERRIGDHHRLVRSSCGPIEDVDCVVGGTACLTPPVATTVHQRRNGGGVLGTVSAMPARVRRTHHEEAST